MRQARAWTAAVLRQIGRDDLVTTAELATSELVTNAIMHAEPPYLIALHGTPDHPRIEVTDHTPGPLRPTSLTVAEGGGPTTFGRGLALVSIASVKWGTQTDLEGLTKRVWFEPAPDLRDDADPAALLDHELFGYSEEAEEPPPGAVTVRLLNLPVQLFATMRRFHYELRRELRLMEFSDRDRYPIAVELHDAFAAADAERRASVGLSLLDDAIAAGAQRLDLDYAITPAAPGVVLRLQEVIVRCCAILGTDHLLAITPDPVLLELQAWYYGEFQRQAQGFPPIAWSGPLSLPADTLVN